MEALFNHLVLPPNLPGRQDTNHEDQSQEFVQRLVSSVKTLGSVSPPAYRDAFSVLEQSLRVCGELNHGRLDRKSLLASFTDIGKRPLALYIVEQNAAIIIRVDVSDSKTVVFEAFEASPSSEKVLASENALLWSFPGRAASISLSTFQNPDFQESLADFLEKASMDALSRFTAKARKAQVDVNEIRDTNDPALITQMLFPLLETIGSRVQVTLLRKRVRDDVNIDESLMPWRRHPFWLILRVFCQRQLCLTMGDLDGRACYKMCITMFLAQFMLDAHGKLRPEQTLLLRSKICRRLAKVEMEKEQEIEGGIYHSLLHAVQPWLSSTIEAVSKQMSLVFESFKAKTVRRVEKLPAYAPPTSLRLSLPCSGDHLANILAMRPAPQDAGRNKDTLKIKDEGIRRLQNFTKLYFDLSQMESDHKSLMSTVGADASIIASMGSPDEGCVELANLLCNYFERGITAYRGCPDQMSEFILKLLVMWTTLDSVALNIDPKLREYHPVFNPELFNALQLPKASDLSRLAAAQSYLQRRIDNSRRPDIFSPVNSTDSYAYQAFQESRRLQQLQGRVQADSDEAREEKEDEFNQASTICDELTQKIAGLSCLCLFGLDGKRTKEDLANCTKCFLWRRRNRLEIDVFEEYLPERSTDCAAIIFEIQIPRWFQAYRNATWRIIRDLSHPTKVEEGWTPLELRNFEQLSPYFANKVVSGGIILASTQKSFTQTHFGQLRVRQTTIDDVVVPFGPQFELYDLDQKIWVKDLDRSAMTLQHLCGIFIPSFLREVLPPAPHPPAVVDGPTSYQQVANQRVCPPKASLHEFSAYQKLLLGDSQRWVNILSELGSSNLNFSTGETARLMTEVGLQAGPSVDGSDLRAAFLPFEDTSFCQCLAEQIEQRMNTISSNFRESSCMELLINLMERLYTLSQSSVLQSPLVSHSQKGTAKHMAHRLIGIARLITLRWINRLRGELKDARDANAAERMAGYAFRASILCRRTFALTTKPLGIEDLSIYCEASVALQGNITQFESNANIRMMLIRDTRMAWRIRHYVSAGLLKHPGALEKAISNGWDLGNVSSCPARFSRWEQVEDPPNWVTSQLTTDTKDFSFSQSLHFNYVEGYLLVDGKPLGRLPTKIRNDPIVIELFGSSHLETTPSGHQGMTHRLATLIQGNQIHFGLRNDQVVIRYVSSRGAFELIPRSVFTKNNIVDIPAKLIEGCFHWLDLSARKLEIRTRANIWKPKISNWVIDLRGMECRKGSDKVTRLVDPNSEIARSVMRTFSHFERPERILITQSTKGRLTVELTGFDLLFLVNKSMNLEEPKLKFEVDPNQNAGTLYGLQSQLVLRDIQNSSRRCVLVPLGSLVSRQSGPHVNVTLDPAGEPSKAYARFDVNTVLSRLEASPEPVLVFTLAYIHALTSFSLPDPLTSRTGTEEAISILESGLAQPWEPLGDAARRLDWIAGLAPSREYYPRDRKRLGKSIFSPHLTMTISHDRLEILAHNLAEKSKRLEPFFKNRDEVELLEPTTHLRKRATARRALYEPVSMHSGTATTGDRVYQSRDLDHRTPESQNVTHIVGATLSRPLELQIQQGLEILLQKEKVVGGFLEGDGSPPTLNALVEDSVVSQFGTLVSFARSLDHLFGLAFRLALLAFHEDEIDLLRVLVAFARLDSLKVLPVPDHPVFVDFGVHDAPEANTLQQLLRPLWPEFCHTKKGKRNEALRDEHVWRCEEECRLIARHLCKQWPAARLSVDGLTCSTDEIDPGAALECIQPIWDHLIANRDLHRFVSDVQAALDKYMVPYGTAATDSVLGGLPANPPGSRTYFSCPTRGRSVIPSLATELMRRSATTLERWNPKSLLQPRAGSQPTIAGASAHLRELEGILRSFSGDSNVLRKRYGEDLEASLRALRSLEPDSAGVTLKAGSSTPLDILRRIQESHGHETNQRNSLISSLAQGDSRYHWLNAAGLWPGTDTRSLLEQLRSSAMVKFGPGVKKALVDFGLSITLRQWLNRILQATLRAEKSKLQECLTNIGHENWNPYHLPDWLLIEIDGDILIRPHQIDVAHQIISPSSNANSVMQLMMGQGKTSVIVPLAIAVLANCKKLVRLVVPKALLLSTAQILQTRLGGLVGRPVRHLPFSRRSSSRPDMIRLYSQLHKEILHDYGVMLTTPDHMLSFKLSGLQRLVDSKSELGNFTPELGECKSESARLMIKFAEELNNGCRDVIDESDLTLGVKTQLIYPSGPQLVVDGAPQRWEVIEQLLLLVEDHVPTIRKKFPRGLEIVRLQAGKGFPMIHFLQEGAEDELHNLITEDIILGRTPFLRPADSVKGSNAKRQQIRKLLTEPSLKKLQEGKEGLKESMNLFADMESAPKVLMLVRGLLLNRILLVTLAKRYNVTYGLHPLRDPVAVPYDARGVPSEQAEFGHPDVSIILTVLSFFYGGLSMPQFRQILEHVLKQSDDPAASFDRLVSSSDLPDSLRHYYVINSDDIGQVEDLYRYLRYNRTCAIQYLNTFVFPCFARQFAQKNSCSAWDIPLFHRDATDQRARTSGFSGTNDNKALLPLTICQDSVLSQHTNAEVLSYLLQTRNRGYRVAAANGRRFTEEDLLRKLVGENFKVLIDAGAFILEMSNEALARAWLALDNFAKAAVYFENGRPWVCYKSGMKKLPLVATPWADNITHEILVFFDEAHCRGVDLRLPLTAKGAVTLALGQTKDHTVQAAMRLRQLATTQSVVFFAPPEVDARLRDICRVPNVRLAVNINSSHVIRFLLEQTCRANEQLQNLHIAQGMDFSRRLNAQWKYENFLTDKTHRTMLLDAIQAQERQTLEQQYGSTQDNSIKGSAGDVSFPCLKAFMRTLVNQRQHIGDNVNGIKSSALEEVEQEREVEFQVEEVRQVARPVKYEALKFPRLHSAINSFVRTGKLEGEAGYMHAFESLKKTAIGMKFEVQGTGSRFFCSKEFSRTVALGKLTKTADNFLRPVEWILWSHSTQTALIVVPEEVEILIPMIRRRGHKAAVHLITYAAPVVKSMMHFNDLKYYTLPMLPRDHEFPKWFLTELGFFSGRLYVSFKECVTIKEYLRESIVDQEDDDNIIEVSTHDADGDNSMANCVEKVIITRQPFARNLTAFLLEWLALRRQVQDIMQTPMGYILQGRFLSEEHPFFAAHTDRPNEISEPQISTSSSNDKSNDSEVESEEEDDGWSHDEDWDEEGVKKVVFDDDGNVTNGHAFNDDALDDDIVLVQSGLEALAVVGNGTPAAG